MHPACWQRPCSNADHRPLHAQVAFILEQLEEVQLAGGKHTFANRPVVILADHDREEMDSLVHSTLKSSRALEVHTRSGKPWK